MTAIEALLEAFGIDPERIEFDGEKKSVRLTKRLDLRVYTEFFSCELNLDVDPSENIHHLLRWRGEIDREIAL